MVGSVPTVQGQGDVPHWGELRRPLRPSARSADHGVQPEVEAPDQPQGHNGNYCPPC